jgi:hypothetical protein
MGKVGKMVISSWILDDLGPISSGLEERFGAMGLHIPIYSPSDVEPNSY